MVLHGSAFVGRPCRRKPNWLLRYLVFAVLGADGGWSDSPPRFGEAIAVLTKSLPNAKVGMLPGQKHQAMDTAPALFVKAVQAFLDPRQA